MAISSYHNISTIKFTVLATQFIEIQNPDTNRETVFPRTLLYARTANLVYTAGTVSAASRIPAAYTRLNHRLHRLLTYTHLTVNFLRLISRLAKS